jgi:2',3'-cyclic-nucleotide 2'-phosphodiesterase (5'-nucleotidase family)/LysM repeat protein
MKRLRQAGRLLLAILILQLLVLPSAAWAGQGETTVTIVHVNDVHSRVEQTDANIGYAKLAAFVKRLKAENPNTLLLDAGDTLHGQTIANLERGGSIVRMMNAVGFDAMTTGNHDYNYGYERLLELAGEASFPVLAANVYGPDGTRLFEPYAVLDASGVRVAVFGLATPETTYKTHPNNVAGLTFADPVEEAKRIVAELDGKADAVIALVHLGVDEASVDTSLKLAEEVPGIDLIVDGHSHTALPEGLEAGGTLIVQAGEYGKYIGVVELTVGPAGAKAKNARLIPAEDTAGIEPDPAVLEVIEEVKAGQEAVLSEVVGRTPVDLDGEREHVRTGETNLGNLIADAMLLETGADVALTNGGGIRASIPAGDITKGQVITVLPFGNYIQTKNVTGAVLLEALEHGVSAWPEPLGGFPHVAGLTFKIDPDKPMGERVHDVRVGGEPLDPEAVYSLATNDFLAAGGDQYTMLAETPVTGDFASLEEAVIRYLQAKGEVAPGKEGRILVEPARAADPAPDAAQDREPGPTPQQTKPQQPAPQQPAPQQTAPQQPAPQQPAQQQTAPQQPAPQKPASGQRVHIVKKGDTLWAIARKYGTTWQKLAEINQLENPDLIFPGQRILLP